VRYVAFKVIIRLSTQAIYIQERTLFNFMGEKKSISALVSGGEASAGPPLGPALGPMGLNVLQVVNTINEKTRDFPGMKVPVKVEVDTETKQFTVEVGIPPTAALIAKEGGFSKGSGTSGSEYVGELSMENITKIARMKIDSSYAIDIKGAAREVIGTCLSMGVKVDGKAAKDVYREISSGMYDEKLL
jgi:large subunit ribosomal protein L11